MNASAMNGLQKAQSVFREQVAVKYQLYNGLFLTLPFEGLDDTGVQLPLFARFCSEKLAEGRSPLDIVRLYLRQRKNLRDNDARLRHLFQLIQLVERQVVLFDALEDAAFAGLNDLEGPGTLPHLIHRAAEQGKSKALLECLEDAKVRVVLTAHPTQFYPDSILGILSDLSRALGADKLPEIRDLLLQMGQTRFQNRRKPTPIEEAGSLLWFLEHVFYPTLPEIQARIVSALPGAKDPFAIPAKIELGFWPGGDRDGNPFVTAPVTAEVSRRLHEAIIRLYLEDLRQLRRRLTFEGVAQPLQLAFRRLRAMLREQMAAGAREGGVEEPYAEPKELLHDLKQLRLILVEKHGGLFLDQLDNFIYKVQCFGFHFASMDVRQDSRVHARCLSEMLAVPGAVAESHANADIHDYVNLSDAAQGHCLEKLLADDALQPILDAQGLEAMTRDTLDTFAAIRNIQARQGVMALHRYVISNSGSVADVLGVLAMARLAGWKTDKVKLDIVPLFETIEDLHEAPKVLAQLFASPVYLAHLKKRDRVQTIMLGFSDGTKDGGYITANWAIYQAKQKLTAIARQHGMRIVFFDGRGGPPSRGGGNTHKFYRSLGSDIAHEEIQITIQGQTISSNFGTLSAARYNLEQLLTASLESRIFSPGTVDLDEGDQRFMERLSKASHAAYKSLREDSLFLPYLEEMTPLAFYGQLNIASRPTRRKSQSMRFEDLRAIPFVGAWSQMKQNIPGFFGVGEGFKKLAAQGQKKKFEELYSKSLFFRTLVENAMMSLLKSFFPLTRYLEKDKRFGRLWRRIFREATLSKEVLKEATGQLKLLENSPVVRESIHMREKIVLPVLVIQQWALLQLKQARKEGAHPAFSPEALEKMIVKSMGAIINAGRNSA